MDLFWYIYYYINLIFILFQKTKPFKIKLKTSPIIEKLQVDAPGTQHKHTVWRSGAADIWGISAPFWPHDAGALVECMQRGRERALSPEPQSAQINDLIGSWTVHSLCWGSNSNSDHRPPFS